MNADHPALLFFGDLYGRDMGMGFAHPCKFGCYSHPNLFIYVCAIPRTAYLAVGIGAPPEAFQNKGL